MELTGADWTRVRTIARELTMDVDRNELGKIVAYAKRTRKTDKILALIEALPRSGYVRSGRTRGYLERIASVLNRELRGLDGERSLAVLAWAFRLMTTYQAQYGTNKAAGRRRK